MIDKVFLQKCLDIPQDLPGVEERKSNIEFYAPKQAKCPGNQVCCRGKKEIDTIQKPGATKCSDFSPAHECTTFELCNPDTFAIKENKVDGKITNDTLSTLFTSVEGGDAKLFVQNSDSGIAVNPDLSPCVYPQLVCCVPKEDKVVQGTAILECQNL